MIKYICILFLTTSMYGWNGLEYTETAIILSAPLAHNIKLEIGSVSGEPLLLTSYLVNRWPCDIPFDTPRGQYVLIPYENIKFNADCASLFPDSCYVITVSHLTKPKELLNPKKYVLISQQESYLCLFSFESSEPFHLYRLSIGIIAVSVIVTVLTIIGVRKLLQYRSARNNEIKIGKEKLDRDIKCVKFKYPELTDHNFIATHPYNTLLGDSAFMFDSYCQAGQWLLHENSDETMVLWKKDPQLLTIIAHNWAHINMCKYMHTQVKSRLIWLIRVHNLNTADAVEGMRKITEKVPDNIISSLETNARIHAFDLINKATGKKALYNYDALEAFDIYLNEAMKKEFQVDYMKDDRVQGAQDVGHQK